MSAPDPHAQHSPPPQSSGPSHWAVIGVLGGIVLVLAIGLGLAMPSTGTGTGTGIDSSPIGAPSLMTDSGPREAAEKAATVLENRDWEGLKKYTCAAQRPGLDQTRDIAAAGPPSMKAIRTSLTVKEVSKTSDSTAVATVDSRFTHIPADLPDMVKSKLVDKTVTWTLVKEDGDWLMCNAVS
ncbi:hypothetical protein D5S17_19280 [Pseudonocardiaceae bacterium YIM PH 21723]|nr:hypothetical protein D5S17_19280 [Pseudonocardiaceae bacterium YIM PH 21723]